MWPFGAGKPRRIVRIMKPCSIAVLVVFLSLAAASPSLSQEWVGQPFKSNASLAEKWINETCKPADLQGIPTSFTPGYGRTGNSFALFVLCRQDGSAGVQYKVDTVPFAQDVSLKGSVKLVGQYPLGGHDYLLYIEKVK
jgi:hypothetical protein